MSMKSVLILGATGSFGTALIKRLLVQTDYHLTLVSRHASSIFNTNDRQEVVDCDATNLDELSRIIANQDVVYCSISGEDLPIVAKNLVLLLPERARLILMGAVGIYNEIPEDMDGDDNVANNPDQVPNRDAVLAIEDSNLNYTILRPGYLQNGKEEDYVLTFKEEQAKGYISTIPSVVNFAINLITNNEMYVRQSVSITKDMTNE